MSWLEAKGNTRRMTSDEVLTVFNDSWRQFFDGDPVSETGECSTITRDWTVDALLFDLFDIDCDDETWREVGAWLSQWFGFDATADELECLLRKPTKTTVGDLCDFIATRAWIEKLSPAKIMGQTSWEAGIFRTVHKLLKNAGADVSNLSPSSELEPYLKEHSQLLQSELSKLVPGYLPAFSIRCAKPVEWLGNFAGWMAFLGWLAMMSGLALGYFSNSALPWFIGVPGFGMLVSGYALIWLYGRFEPRFYQLGEFVTFRDLCFALAAHKRAGDGGHLSVLRTSESGYITGRAREEETIEPVVVFGRSCLAASLFRSISEALARDGADVSRLAPSTEVEPYLRAHRRALIMHLSKVAPGKAPPIREEYPYHTKTIRRVCRRILWGSYSVYCAIAFIIGVLLRPDLLIPFGIAAIGISVALASIMFCCDLVTPTSVRFGDCATFKDLCRLIAGIDGAVLSADQAESPRRVER